MEMEWRQERARRHEQEWEREREWVREQEWRRLGEREGYQRQGSGDSGGSGSWSSGRCGSESSSAARSIRDRSRGRGDHASRRSWGYLRVTVAPFLEEVGRPPSARPVRAHASGSRDCLWRELPRCTPPAAPRPSL